MRANHLVLLFVSVIGIVGNAFATLAPQFVPVAGLGTGVPYPAAALAADLALANYATYDLRVAIGGGERWTAGLMQSSTNATASGVGPIPGIFYAAPTHVGAVDRDFPQRQVYTTSGDQNFLWDTWVNIITSEPDAEGKYWAGGPTTPGFRILGQADYPAGPGVPGPSIMPRTIDNPGAINGAGIGQHTINVAWGHDFANSQTYPLPGTYTIARLTFDAGAGGNWILGYVTGTQHIFNFEPFAFQIPVIPEPASLRYLAMSLFMLVQVAGRGVRT